MKRWLTHALCKQKLLRVVRRETEMEHCRHKSAVSVRQQASPPSKLGTMRTCMMSHAESGAEKCMTVPIRNHWGTPRRERRQPLRRQSLRMYSTPTHAPTRRQHERCHHVARFGSQRVFMAATTYKKQMRECGARHRRRLVKSIFMRGQNERVVGPPNAKTGQSQRGGGSASRAARLKWRNGVWVIVPKVRWKQTAGVSSES